MKLPQTGGCQCRALRYEITQAPIIVCTCHCTDCHRMTSSAFSMALVLPAGAFRLVRVEPKAVQHISTRHGLNRDEYMKRWGLRSDHQAVSRQAAIQNPCAPICSPDGLFSKHIRDIEPFSVGSQFGPFTYEISQRL
jgi:hypothetical protein